MATSRRDGRIPAPFALPAAGTALLALGALAALTHPPAAGVVAGTCLVVAIVAYTAERAAVLPLLLVAWMTATAFARTPYGQLHAGGRRSLVAAVALTVVAAVAFVASVVGRPVPRRRFERTLKDVVGLAGLASAVNRRRQLLGVGLAAVALPPLTAVLATYRSDLSLANDLLFYLVVVMAVTVIGGFWPAVASAIAASLLLNWYFTVPLHTFTIQRPDSLLALLLFVVVAMAVSTVVHLAAIRAAQAARNEAEATMLLELARTALAEEDTPLAVLRHLHERVGLDVELLERVGERWVRVAAAGSREGLPTRTVRLRDDVQLVARGRLPDGGDRLLDAAAGQVAAALDRDRLRTQAAQTEALAAGNRMRTALLAAVSHDLRTPMASIKASVSSLLQTDVKWSDDDVTAFLETIGESTDRLDALIANLLDMTRVQSGSLQPFLQPASVDEVALRALQGIPGGRRVRVDVPEDLGLVLTDAGLLERALANLLANALRWSPQNFPPVLTAAQHGNRIAVSVVDYGPGVPVSDRERIFAPFQRLGDQDATTGVGLGLAVARGFVEAIGGSIEVGETPGGGLTMTVSLPASSPVDADVATRETAS